MTHELKLSQIFLTHNKSQITNSNVIKNEYFSILLIRISH
jgi:hypothetical protein